MYKLETAVDMKSSYYLMSTAEDRTRQLSIV